MMLFEKSTGRASRQFDVLQITVWRVLKRQLHMKQYKRCLVQALTNDDKVVRRHFVMEMVGSMLEVMKPSFRVYF